MAEARISVDVAVEPAVHNALMHFLREVYQKHGVIITAMSAEWLSTSTMERPAVELASIRMSSSMLAGPAEDPPKSH